jgi:hypothetical protein
MGLGWAGDQLTALALASVGQGREDSPLASDPGMASVLTVRKGCIA